MRSVIERPLQFAAMCAGQIEFQALCFGDFHLGQQMKVTRRPGGIRRAAAGRTGRFVGRVFGPNRQGHPL